MYLRLSLILALFLLLAGCVQYESEQSSEAIAVELYSLGGLNARQVAKALNDLDSEQLPVRASTAGANQVLVSAPPHVHQRLPELLDGLGRAEGDGSVQRLSLWLRHVKAVPAEAFEVGEGVPEAIGRIVNDGLRQTGLGPQRIEWLDEAYAAVAVDTRSRSNAVDLLGGETRLQHVQIGMLQGMVGIKGMLIHSEASGPLRFDVAVKPGQAVVIGQGPGAGPTERSYYVLQIDRLPE